EGLALKGLRKGVSEVGVRWNVGNSELITFDIFTDEVVAHIDMFDFRVEGGVVRQPNPTSVIAVERGAVSRDSWRVLETKLSDDLIDEGSLRKSEVATKAITLDGNTDAEGSLPEIRDEPFCAQFVFEPRDSGRRAPGEYLKAGGVRLDLTEAMGRLCALVRAQLVRAQHADAAPGAVDNDASISGR
ncbi:hypothetical protein POSPLADRAFT_1139941, partial [Postia placenta MAD-698-R-SB12]